MLCTLNDVLPRARKLGYCVPAFDYVHDVFVRAVLDACEELRAPVILSALEQDLQGVGMAYMAGLVKAVAPSYTVPVVLHLDHGDNFDIVAACIANGFTSVMYDGSHLPLAQNIEETREVVKYAHARGVAVEAELGFVAGTDLEGGDQGEGRLTEPSEVERFVRETEVDALAVSIGTAHGIYKAKPKLDLNRLAEIAAVTDTPLVLHGGSGTPEDQLVPAIRGGITKLNIYADMRIAMNRAAPAVLALAQSRPDKVPDKVLEPFHEALREEAEDKIRITMSNGRY
jgi:fructose-bisphosphate aldolase class II